MKRWTKNRKLEVVLGVLHQNLSLDFYVRKDGLTVAEIETWIRAYQAEGLPGLSAYRLPVYRDLKPPMEKKPYPHREGT